MGSTLGSTLLFYFQLLAANSDYRFVYWIIHGLLPYIYLYEPDDVGEHEECGDVVHPLEEPEQDEGSPVDDEPGREDGSHAPHRQVLSHQGPWDS